MCPITCITACPITCPITCLITTRAPSRASPRAPSRVPSGGLPLPADSAHRVANAWWARRRRAPPTVSEWAAVRGATSAAARARTAADRTTQPLVRWRQRDSTQPHTHRPIPSRITSPQLSSPSRLASPHRTSPYITSPHLTSPHRTSHHGTSRHVPSRPATSRHVPSRHGTAKSCGKGRSRPAARCSSSVLLRSGSANALCDGPSVVVPSVMAPL